MLLFFEKRQPLARRFALGKGWRLTVFGLAGRAHGILSRLFLAILRLASFQVRAQLGGETFFTGGGIGFTHGQANAFIVSPAQVSERGRL